MAYTGATAGYQAGANANDTTIAYALESTFGEAATGPYQLTRFTGETFARTKSRSRPNEINAVYEAAQAITTQESVSGTLSGALSAGTYDDLISGVMLADFGVVTVQLVSGASAASIKGNGDGSYTLNASTAGLLNPLRGSQVLTIGSDTGDANGSYAIISNDGTNIIAVPTTAGLAPAQGLRNLGNSSSLYDPAQLLNGNTFKSFTVRELIGGQYFVRTGGFVNKMTLTFQQGQFANVALDMMFAGETYQSTDPAASLLPAPTGTVMDTVNGFSSLYINKVAKVGAKQVSVVVTRDGAAQDFAMGSSKAVGMQPGSALVSGTVQLFHKNTADYALFSTETLAEISLRVRDAAGKGYGIVIPNATLQNPKINAGSKNSTIVASYDIEGNPLPVGGSVGISRL